jgi:RNA polymerase-binding transcription factor DksA
MRTSELQQYKRRLLDLRDRLRTNEYRLIDAALADARPPGEHEYPLPPSEFVDKETTLEFTERDLHEAVTAALERIEQGTYGTCKTCGGAIPHDRLAAVPYATLCIACERQAETQ